MFVEKNLFRLIFVFLMDYRRNLVDTCKGSSVLVVSTLAVSLPSTDYVMINCHCYTL